MKTLVKLLVAAAAILVGIVAVIKFVKGCSWKDAVGITEELWLEIKSKCACCNAGDEDGTETTEAG